jgi:hypothetical protein
LLFQVTVKHYFSIKNKTNPNFGLFGLYCLGGGETGGVVVLKGYGTQAKFVV